MNKLNESWNDEIKKGSKLIIRQGQDAIFMYNGKIEGIFKDEGSFDIESQIIPFLSTLKGFKFGFNSGVRAEVLFVNTKEFTERWGTKNPISVQEAIRLYKDRGLVNIDDLVRNVAQANNKNKKSSNVGKLTNITYPTILGV